MLPGPSVRLWELCAAGELAAARELYAELLPLARLDMTPKLVQYFKAALDELGLGGGPVPAAPVAADRRRAWRGPPGGGTLLAVSSLTAGWIRFHSHPEGLRRVIAIVFTPDIHLIYTAQG